MSKEQITEEREPLTMQSFLSEAADFDELIAALAFEEETVMQAATRQPYLFVKAARLRVQTMREMARAEATLDQTEAEVGMSVRERAQATGTKITESGIGERIATDPQVREAQKQVRIAAAREELGKLMVEAYRHRRDSIRVIAEAALIEGNVNSVETARMQSLAGLRKDARSAEAKHRKVRQLENGEE